ncbi:hypothetical protein [Dyadobacter sp. CY343]|uniref:hypothetical protein n=1 Tax=Dyadobacter sp. CY343 TaxID=2907299 RepID=UPI001F2761C8|nr:hypothetical protein [Dyadobacter sp. CY343]MCE7058978.1 hypothetical protein [Dyadobacter sp. CY343]
MVIERTDKEVIIRLPATVDIEDLQEFVHFARYKELTSKFRVDQEEVDDMASSINASWWKEHGSQHSK